MVDDNTGTPQEQPQGEPLNNTGAGENTPPKPEMKVGTPKIVGEKLTFEGASHPDMETAITKNETAINALKTKLGTSEEATKALGELKKANFADSKTALKFDAIAKQHAPEEFKAFNEARTALGKAHGELHAAQAPLLKDFKPEGVAQETVSKAVSGWKTTVAQIKREHNPGFLNSRFSTLFEEGVVPTVTKNFGLTAWKEAPVKAFAKVAGTGAGVVLMSDAFLRSQKTGPDGQPTDRSTLGRFTEFVAGAGVTAGSALHRFR